MNTAKVYIAIPYVTPALEIDCSRSNVTTYLEYLFFPYAILGAMTILKYPLQIAAMGKLESTTGIAKGRKLKTLSDILKRLLLETLMQQMVI